MLVREDPAGAEALAEQFDFDLTGCDLGVDSIELDRSLTESSATIDPARSLTASDPTLAGDRLLYQEALATLNEPTQHELSLSQSQYFSEILGSSVLDPAERAQLQKIFDHLSYEDREALIELMLLKNDGAILHSKDSKGHTMLENLVKLSKEAGGMLPEVVRLLARPDSMVQGDHNSCAATQALWDFQANDPGEFSRVVVSLMIDGRVDLRDGSTVKLNYGERDKSGRTLLGQVLQASFMDFANGWDSYDNAKDKSHRHFVGDYQGLLGPQIVKMFDAFYDRKHSFTPMTPEQVQALIDRGPNGAPATTVSIWLQDPKKAADREVSQHIISVLCVIDGRVYFRNPMGAGAMAGGKLVQGSDGAQVGYPNGVIATIENGSTGVWSMSVDDFRKCANLQMQEQRR